MEFSENIKKLMENESDDVDESAEKISEAFICCICLDLLFKPVVLACGHISCFWCVYRSMSGLRESHCPICRCSYYHFPTVCWMLHFLLFKMYPIAYKRREIQSLESEKEKGSFSPQFDGPLHVSQTEQDFYYLDSSQVSPLYEYDSSSDPSSSRKDEVLLNVDQLKFASTAEETGRLNLQIPVRGIGGGEGKKLLQRITTVTCQQISVDDALCTFCKQLLFHPLVLNCGHVYCESCISVPTNVTLKCQVCQSAHPGQAPKVCLELKEFLEQKFEKEYAQRRSSIQLKQAHFQSESPISCSSEAAKESFHLSSPSGENLFSWWGDQKVHIGAGCDCCGMFPIIGDRYRCKDCVEAIGYDLCGDCYSTGSKLPGRFNQQHTPEHKFKIMRPNSIRNIMLTLLRGQLGDISAAPNPSSEASESLVPSLSGDAQENAETGFVTASETEEDQGNHQ